VSKKAHDYMKMYLYKRKIKHYEERLLLESKISKSIYDNLNRLYKLLGKEDVQMIMRLFSELMRTYFKSLFNLGYEFTYEEILNEIETRKINNVLRKILSDFFYNTLELEFSGKTLEEENLKEIMDEFKKILSYTSPKQDAEVENKLEYVSKRIRESREMIEQGNLNDAYFEYLGVLDEYNKLGIKEREEVELSLSVLYDKLSKALQEYGTEGKVEKEAKEIKEKKETEKKTREKEKTTKKETEKKEEKKEKEEKTEKKEEKEEKPEKSEKKEKKETGEVEKEDKPKKKPKSEEK